METLIAFVLVVFSGLSLLTAAGAVAAWVRASRAADRIRDLEVDFHSLEARVRAMGRASGPPAGEVFRAAVPPVALEAGAFAPERPPIPPPPAASRPPGPGATPLSAPSIPGPPRRPPAPAPAGPDFATNLGPKLLVATGALAFMVFLGLFVKYAWDNNWVGPAGRVLSGALLGIGLLAGGLRLLDREYRPLGQGLAAAGLAGLYTSAFAAHGFYALVPREAAGLLMLAITSSAVLLSARLDARLLAALAWVGGYLTPVLLSTGQDKALALFLYLGLLAAGAQTLHHRKPWGETLPLAMAGTLILYAAWYARFFRPERFDVAALGIVMIVLLFGSGWSRGAGTELVGGFTWLVAGGFAVASCARADRPLALAVFLLALAGVAVLARRRWAWTEMAALAAAAFSVAAWCVSFDVGAARAGDAYLVALPVAGVFFVSLLVRGLVKGRALDPADVGAHLATAFFVWSLLHFIHAAGHPGLLGFLALALSALYLGFGLAAKKARPEDRLQARTLLGLAASFVTIAIPVQLGLHAITLAWAVEGVLLLALGVRSESRLARAGGYAVLGLAVARLLVRHLPLHDAAFTPILNPGFGVWLFVIAALVAAVFVARRADPGMGRALSVVSLSLLFVLLTGETGDAFAQRARDASLRADVAAAERARRLGGVAISVLWTMFATGMLAGGLFLRSRPLFYAAYALFAVTGAKVVLWDLSQSPIPYRMMTFLALGLLLMAGAYLNLRFRERLAPSHEG